LSTLCAYWLIVNIDNDTYGCHIMESVI